MRKSLIIFIIILILSVAGCRSSNQSSAVFDKAESLMSSAPDSALHLLNALDPQILNSRALRARHALLFSQAFDKNGVDLTADSIIAPAVDYYAHHGRSRDKALTNYYHGRIHNNKGDIGKAATLMMEAEKYAMRDKATDLLGLIYNCRANLYYSQYSFNEALSMYDKADSCFRMKGKMDFSAFMLKAKAKVFALQRNNKAAISINKKAIDIFDSIGNLQQVRLLTSSLAFLMKDSHRISTDSIKRFLSRAYARYTSGITPKSDYPVWAWIHFQEHDIDSAQYYVNRAIHESWNTSDQESGLLALVCQIEEAAGNYRAATTHWKKAYKLLDSLSDHEKVNLIQRAEERYENKELQHVNEVLQLRSRLVLSIVALIFTVLVSAFLLTLRHWRRVIHKKSEENKQYRLFIDKLNDDFSTLKSQYEQVNQQTDTDSEEAKLLQALEKRLNGLQKLLDLAYSGSCKPQTFYTAFKEYAANINNDDYAFSDLEYVINKRYHGVIDYVRREHPSLTNSELNMLCMMLFGFSFDCMRLIFNHENVDSIYSRRTKIREKLGLPPRAKPEKYLVDLSVQLKAGKNPKKGV